MLKHWELSQFAKLQKGEFLSVKIVRYILSF